MGVTAENVATKFQVTRDDQDKFALRSQEKALKAQNESKFENEIIHPNSLITYPKHHQEPHDHGA